MSNVASQVSRSGGMPPQFASETPVFERLGDIIRALHNTLTEIGADNVLSEAASEFPSARERLQHIGNLTEKAANTVLNKVEQTMPLQEQLGDTAEKLQAEWEAADEHPLAARTIAFMAQSQSTGATTYQALSEIMMAQDFQDLTGQLIKKVVSLIERTENDLLKLLIDAAPPGTISLVKKDELMAGPGAAGSIALEQSSVDDLLADLGF
ncbi:protein phosphatase CheZ [Undibacterium sp.]|uniref:protein phosphatase CheZ n=1 Tax=Undibacterium sp. TaxID=1914977 RepID=UPI00374C8E60